MQRDLDIVVFGATGDTGVSACCCLYFKGKTLGISSWAPAARNLGKLKSDLLDRLADREPREDGLAPSEPIQADSGDYESLLRMCKRTKCVVACAGPFSQYGEGVIKACVEAGTHYVDVTGEVPWVEKMERKYGEEAEKKGVTLVSLAGYDSVPPDLCTFLAAKGMRDEGEALQRFDIFCGGGGGAMPSGTINTLVHGVDEAKGQFWNKVSFVMLGTPARRPRTEESQLATTSGPRKTYVPQTEAANLGSNLIWSMCPGYSSLAGQFCLPHFMAPININVVHRTAAQEGYGGLVYRERMAGLPTGLMSLYGLVPTICGIAGGLLLALFLPLPYSTSAIVKLRDTFNPALMASARKLMLNGFQSTGVTIASGFGISRSGAMTAKTELKCKYDPGLGFTMLSACTLASVIVKRLESDDKPRTGFQTAVTAVGGEALADALRAMGVELKVTTQRTSSSERFGAVLGAPAGPEH
eukprot:CAMPEP_0183439074 /NCGR_PEP_ID=MMETSP0370-20130417/77779_1 /TAXON_ID=268820 /ORGANISM="Peridinium aciculiferum, Strain PAER-2" /LENGTH=469 /DNA_ID=CAMNT_0025627439 /DNA_START=74 /DNA_END=1481 /DNA_ORIENTATION=+